jgi:hypothetical protein
METASCYERMDYGIEARVNHQAGSLIFVDDWFLSEKSRRKLLD